MSFDTDRLPDNTEKPVLAAVDFSDGAKFSLIWAIDFADKVGAPLSIVHVIHDPADAPGSYHEGEDNRVVPIEELAARRFDQFLAEVAKERPKSAAFKKADTILIDGLPTKRILSVAQKIGAGHIVVGCQGTGGLPDVLLGSVAQRIVKKSKIPVTTVRLKKANLKESSEKTNQHPHDLASDE